MALWDLKKNIVLVGDRYCGKTSLALRLSSDLYIGSYLPTQLVNDFSAEVVTGNLSCKLTLLDLSGSCNNQNILSSVYSNCDMVVVCFDLANRASLASVESKWLPQLEKKCPGIPFIIAGCKSDKVRRGGSCRSRADCTHPTHEECLELLLRTRAKAYVECSSKSMYGVETLTQTIVEVAQKKRTIAQKIASSIKLLRKRW